MVDLSAPVGCGHNGYFGISGNDILEHLGNFEWGSAWRDWCEMTDSGYNPTTGESTGGGPYASEINSRDNG